MPLRKRKPGIAVDAGASDDAPLSPWWRRVLASSLDALVILAVESAVLLALGHGTFFVRHQSEGQWLGHELILLVIASLYYGAFMQLTDGRTIGKLALGIRVVRIDEHAMTVARAVWRQVVILILIPDLLDWPGHASLVGVVVSLLVFADVLWPLWDRENRALHDMAAGTRVRFAGTQ